jgi:hypothetical protein
VRRSCPAGAAAAIAITAAFARAQPRVTTLQQGPDEVVLAVTPVDVDGDGASDLAVVVRRERTQERRLLVYRQARDAGADRFGTKPQERALEPDVVAFAFADIDARAGAELLLCTPRTLAAATWPDGEPAALCVCQLLWQPGHAAHIVALQDFVRDLDGDGVADVLLPEPGGFRLALQRRDQNEPRLLTQVLRVPRSDALPGFLRGRIGDDDKTLRISFGEPTPDPLLSVNDECPAPRVLDFDGDGDLDVVVLARPQVHVFAQQAGGNFGPAPSTSLLAAATERTRLLEPAFYVDVADFDRDGKGDLLVCRAGASGRTFESIVEVWPQPFQEAKARLRLTGLAAMPQLDDVDGDGAPDLSVGTLRTDLLGQLGRQDSSVEAQLNVFLSRQGKPKLPAALTWRVELSPEAAEGARSVAARFFGDADGDGTNDLLLHDSKRTLQVLRARRSGDSVRVEPWWQTALPEGARPPLRMARSPCDDLVVVSPREILHVRLR